MTTESRHREIEDEFAVAARAVNEISGDRLACREPEEHPNGAVAVTVLPRPPGATQWRSTPDREITLTRQTSGEVTQHLTGGRQAVTAVTDTQAAAALDVEVDTWAQSRDAVESGLGTIAGAGAPQERHVLTEPPAEVAARLSELHTAEMTAETNAERLEDADISGKSQRERAAELRREQHEIEQQYGLLEEGADPAAILTRPARVPTDLSQYRDARILEEQHGPGAALALGVAGNHPAARRQRLAQAVAVRESWHAAADAAYAAATWPNEPDVPQPFGLGAVIRAEGDLERALADPESRTQSAERLGLTGHMDWVDDEIFDGQREQWQPDVSDTAEGRRTIGAELVRIAHQVGVQAPSEAASSASATEPARRDRRPALMPPSMSPPRAQERATNSPDLLAPTSGIPF